MYSKEAKKKGLSAFKKEMSSDRVKGKKPPLVIAIGVGKPDGEDDDDSPLKKRLKKLRGN